MATITIMRREERTEPTDHQHIDEHEHGGEGQAEIAEDLDGDVPFAIPFHGWFRVGEGLAGVEDGQPGLVAAERAEIERASALFIWRMA
jgi:hypothetical protein